MSGAGGCLIFFGALILAIGISNKTGCNLGIAGLAFAFLTGEFLMGKTAAQVIAYFPVSVFFTMMIVSFFYGFAAENGALNVLSKWMIYLCRRQLRLLPLLIYAVTFLIAATGAGAGATPVIMAPISFGLARQVGFSPVVAVLAVNLGALAGGIQIWTSSGAMFREIAQTCLGESTAMAAGCAYGFVLLVAPAVFFLLVYLGYQREANAPEGGLSRPQPFNRDQAGTLCVLTVVMALVIVPVLGARVFRITAFRSLSSRMDMKFLCTLGIIVNAALGHGDVRKIIREYIPWPTILMVCGMSTFIGLMAETGVADMMGSLLGENIPPVFVVPLVLLTSGLLSFVTTGPAVIFPLFMPMFPHLSEVSGVSVVTLTAALFAGAGSTGMSPFSQGGAVALAGCGDSAVREKLWPKQLLFSLLFLLFYVLLGFTGFFPFAAGLFE